MKQISDLLQLRGLEILPTPCYKRLIVFCHKTHAYLSGWETKRHNFCLCSGLAEKIKAFSRWQRVAKRLP